MDRMRRRLSRYWPIGWPERRQVAVLLSVMVMAGGLWGFIELAEEVVQGETHAVDRMILLALRDAGDPSNPLGPRWLEELGRDVTALGSVAVLTILTLTAAGFLLIERRPRTAALVLVGVGGGQVLSSLLKYGFARPRPDLVPPDIYVYTASFPSGHAMMSAITYLTLAILLSRATVSAAAKIYILAVGLALALMVGISRIYLAVHWPTDVLGGWAVGAAWAALWWLVARRLDAANGDAARLDDEASVAAAHPPDQPTIGP